MHKEILSPAQTELLDLAAMKAYALGRRSKWKDYVDLYFLFRAQLCFFSDIDYSEPVEFIVPAVAEAEIREMLEEKAIELES